MGSNLGAFGGIAFALLCLAGWFQHLYTCFNEHLYGFLDRGRDLFPSRDHSRVGHLAGASALVVD